MCLKHPVTICLPNAAPTQQQDIPYLYHRVFNRRCFRGTGSRTQDGSFPSKISMYLFGMLLDQRGKLLIEHPIAGISFDIRESSIVCPAGCPIRSGYRL